MGKEGKATPGMPRFGVCMFDPGLMTAISTTLQSHQRCHSDRSRLPQKLGKEQPESQIPQHVSQAWGKILLSCTDGILFLDLYLQNTLMAREARLISNECGRNWPRSLRGPFD